MEQLLITHENNISSMKAFQTLFTKYSLFRKVILTNEITITSNDSIPRFSMVLIHSDIKQNRYVQGGAASFWVIYKIHIVYLLITNNVYFLVFNIIYSIKQG